MKNKIKVLLLVVTAAACMVACGGKKTPYQVNDSENYSVSVRYDANGGFFTTDTSIIVDSYNISGNKVNSDGKVSLALRPTDDPTRGNDAFKVTKNGFIFAGWYTERIESKDAVGNVTYTYKDKWDFAKDLLEVDTNKNHSAEKPVLTLYAAWVPAFTVEFYSLGTNELIGSVNYDPTVTDGLEIPAWDTKTGAMKMKDFPKKSGYTFNGVYFDAEGTNLVEGEKVAHTGKINYENGTATGNVMKLYVDWKEGEWYQIHSAEQFVDNANLNGCYEILADLDFTDEIWPTMFVYGNFNGVINGNGHTFKNIAIEQTNNSKNNAGLFGSLSEKANVNNLTFDTVSFVIKSGTRVIGTNYGLLAGTISSEAEITDIKIVNGAIMIDSSCFFSIDDYSIGLVCGMGDWNVVPDADITCTATGNNPESVKITISGNQVTVEFVTE